MDIISASERFVGSDSRIAAYNYFHGFRFVTVRYTRPIVVNGPAIPDGTGAARWTTAAAVYMATRLSGQFPGHSLLQSVLRNPHQLTVIERRLMRDDTADRHI